MARKSGSALRVGVLGMIIVTVCLAQGEYGRRSFSQGEYLIQVDDREAAIYLNLEHWYSDDLFATVRLLRDALPKRESAGPGHDLPLYPLLVSVSMMETWAKHFDDRLVATIELLMQHGDGNSFIGKAALLERLLEELGQNPACLEESSSRTAIHHILAAHLLGSDSRQLEHPCLAAATRIADTFQSDARAPGKPIGLFTWSSELQAIFRQDRFMQQEIPLDEGVPWFENVARVLTKNGPLRSQYSLILRVAALLANPPDAPSFLEVGDAGVDRVALLPAARTLEGELFKKLHPIGSPIPSDTVVMEEFLDAIRQRKVSLQPTAASGWYDWKTFALEPLVNESARPEAQKVRRGESYARLCEVLFRAALTLRRESLVKDISPPGGGCPGSRKIEIRLTPRISIEPQISYLRRTADSYAFLRKGLVETLGRDALLATPLFAPDGPSGPPVLRELESMERSFRSLAALACLDLGADPDLAGAGLTASRVTELAREGRALLDHQLEGTGWHDDPRVLVPVAYDLGRRRYHCWAILGVQPAFVGIHYSSRQPPKVSVTMAADGSPAPKDAYVLRTWPGITFVLPQLVWAECHTSRPLTRAEFRALCDTHVTPEAIIAALGRL